MSRDKPMIVRLWEVPKYLVRKGMDAMEETMFAPYLRCHCSCPVSVGHIIPIRKISSN